MQAKKDENRVTTLLGVSDLNFETPITVAVDHTTHELLIKGSISVDTSSIATASNQTDGSQKTQIVDGDGDIATVTSNRLDVNVDNSDLLTQLQIINTLVPALYDYIALSYTGDNLTSVVYKTGGASGTTVCTLTLAYTGSTLNSVTRTLPA